MSSKRADTELNMRGANVWEETKALNRGFISAFTELTRYYPHGECEERSHTREHGENNQTVIINLCV